MKKLRVAFLVAMLMGTLIVGSAFANGFSVVKYDDTTNDYEPGEVGDMTYIANGNFNDWTADGYPEAWNTYVDPMNPNWEVHLSQMDYGEGPGNNYAVGMFFRTGSSGSQYGGMYQQVSPELTTDHYWVEVHITAWEHNTSSAYNAVAWYGFSDSEDPGTVTEWRELFPDTYVCSNGAEICNHLGRKEMVHVEAGSYMHVRMGMKFPDHQAWTVFGVDDITIVGMGTDSVGVDDFVDDGDVTWDANAPR